MSASFSDSTVSPAMRQAVASVEAAAAAERQAAASVASNNNDEINAETTPTSSVHPACWITLLVFCLVPTIVGLLVVFGLFAIPVVMLACVGVSAFCTTSQNQPSNNGNEETTAMNSSVEIQQEELKTMSRSEMKQKLIPYEPRQGCCEICLVDFSDSSFKKTIVGSPNPICSHKFHEECILNWLENKPTCPCCRALYLSSSTDVEEGRTDEDGNNVAETG